MNGMEAGPVELTRAERRRYLPLILPADWRLFRESADGASYISHFGLRVIASVAREQDGRRWLHVSCSRADALPSWDDLKLVKDIFVGREAVALQVLPRASRYINQNPYVLHLWHCLNGDVVPDFAKGGTSI